MLAFPRCVIDVIDVIGIFAFAALSSGRVERACCRALLKHAMKVLSVKLRRDRRGYSGRARNTLPVFLPPAAVLERRANAKTSVRVTALAVLAPAVARPV